MLAKCNLKLAERLAEHHNDDEEKELVERNAGVAKGNLELAVRLAEYGILQRYRGYCPSYDCLLSKYSWLLWP